MDLRNLAATPSLDRRPSILSLSLSGYASSNYGGNTTPQLSSQRLNGGRQSTPGLISGAGAGISGPSSGAVASAGHNPSSSTPTQAWSNVAGGLTIGVGPWVEQQQAQAAALKKKKTNDDDDDEHNDSNNDDDDDDDDLIPTAIVIKNIPFAIKKEQLLDVMTKLSLPLPYAFNYHFDNGVFRGLAFANFTLTDETTLVVNQLNGREIGGRKLRVEYKKMLPAQERERIEREKRERRGQLEEQHRTNSNASLALLLSAASTTAATKNLSVGTGTATTHTERLAVSYPVGSTPVPAELNMNDGDVLELYSQLLLYRDEPTKAVYELAFPALLPAQRKNLSLLCGILNLLELYDNGTIIIRRRPGQLPHQPVPASASMMNLTSLLGHPELLRSQSQSALPMRRQTPTPMALGSSNGVPPVAAPGTAPLASSVIPPVAGGPPGSAPAIQSQTPGAQTAASGQPSMPGLRYPIRSNNRSFDVAPGAESPTPQHAFFTSQPTTPADLQSRFAPFGGMGFGYSQLQNGTGDEYSTFNDPLSVKLATLNVDKSGIWGPK